MTPRIGREELSRLLDAFDLETAGEQPDSLDRFFEARRVAADAAAGFAVRHGEIAERIGWPAPVSVALGFAFGLYVAEQRRILDPLTAAEIAETVETDRQADRDEAVGILLDGLGVGSIGELARLVDFARRPRDFGYSLRSLD